MNIFMMQHNYQSKYLVIIDSVVNVYKYEKCKFDQPFLSYQPKHNFIGKSKNGPMTEFSQNQDIVSFDDGNTLLLECDNNEYIYISGLEIVKFEIEDKIIDYISLMGNNIIPYSIAIGEKFTCFLYNRWKFLENDKIEEDTLLNRTNFSLDPFDYHVEKCGVDSFKKIECSLIHSYWLNREEDDDVVEEDIFEQEENLVETTCFNGNNEVVKIFNEKCVICLERDSIYAFRECGHQCICQQCYENKGDIDILKCVVCRR